MSLTQQLEDSWVKEIFTTEELKQYATFESEMKSASAEQKANFEKDWFKFVEEVENNLDQDPRSAKGIVMGRKFMEFVNALYGKKYAHLRTKKFEKWFGEGKGLEQHGLTPEIVSWIEEAMDVYWHDRLYSVLAQVDQESPTKLLVMWNEVMDDMYGEEERKTAIPKLAYNDPKVSPAAKQWLKATFKL